MTDPAPTEKKRRPYGDGAISLRTDGRYAGALRLQDGTRKWFYARTKTEIGKRLAMARRLIAEGKPIADEKTTVSDFLTTWLEQVKPSIAPSTHIRYEQFVRLHVRPTLGRTKLGRLSAMELQRLYTERLAAGLAPASVRQLHLILHHALKDAERWGLVARNPSQLVTPPRLQKHEATTLTLDQARTFLTAIKGHRLEALFVLALSTGMREGELLGLHWQDVDLVKGGLHVRTSLKRRKGEFVSEETKTGKSRRPVALTKRSTDVLKRHKAEQNAERLVAGELWQDWGLVFTMSDGRPIYGATLLRHFLYPLLAKAELPRVRFHELRHSVATLLLEEGVHARIVADLLGHSQTGMTQDTYSHVSPTLQRHAVDVLDRVLGA